MERGRGMRITKTVKMPKNKCLDFNKMTINDWLDYYGYKWKFNSVPTFIYYSHVSALKMIEVLKRAEGIEKVTNYEIN